MAVLFVSIYSFWDNLEHTACVRALVYGGGGGGGGQRKMQAGAGVVKSGHIKLFLSFLTGTGPEIEAFVDGLGLCFAVRIPFPGALVSPNPRFLDSHIPRDLVR